LPQLKAINNTIVMGTLCDAYIQAYMKQSSLKLIQVAGQVCSVTLLAFCLETVTTVAHAETTKPAPSIEVNSTQTLEIQAPKDIEQSDPDTVPIESTSSQSLEQNLVAAPVESTSPDPDKNSIVAPVESTSSQPSAASSAAQLAPTELTPKAETTSTLTEVSTTTRKDFTVFPVGINVGKRNVTESVLVRGAEDGSQAIDFDNWLVPFDEVIQALKIKVTPLESGQLELRSAGFIIRIDPTELRQDPELGTVLSVSDIQTRLGIPAAFNLADYAIQLDPPWLTLKQSGYRQHQKLPVITEGLPYVDSPSFSVTSVGQRLNITGNSNNTTDYQGEFTGVGTVLGGSWFIRTNQPDFTDRKTWRLGEAQYLRQTEQADYALGSQQTFWRSQGDGTYWGATTIQRWGYSPAIVSGIGGFSPTQRLQAEAVGRTIVGEAAPNTLVQLIQGSRDNVIAETLVDSSGVYRFEDIAVAGTRYEVLLYPNGQRAAEPEVRAANFSNLPSKLPVGASALVVSAGLRQESSSQSNFFGDFTDFRGGVSYRRGVAKDLTLGIGAVYDERALGLGEIYYQPENFPLQIAASVLLGTEDGADIDAAISFQPSNKFRADFNTDKFSSRFRASWQVLSGLNLRVGGNTADDALFAGFTFFRTTNHFSAYTSVDYDTNNHLRWSLLSRLDRLQLNSIGNEISTDTDLSYKVSPGKSLSSGHFLQLGYETRKDDNLVTAGWRYRSPYQARDGRDLWQFDLGYGVGSRGNGVLAAVSTSIVPGLVVRARYEGASVTSDGDTFRVELLPFFNTQAKFRSNDSRFEYLRNEGGLWLQPFLDRNNNGKRDPGEKLYVEDTDLLLVLNNEPLALSQPETHDNGVFVRVSPGTYRLDLDPAGYPADWSPVESSYAVEVTPGSYTPVAIPFTPSYTVTGILKDAKGNIMNGARVEAVPTDKGKRTLSVTNGAGIFYLEELQQGTYNLLINGEPAISSALVINSASEPLQELNLQEQ
jgi:hypothetical protein